VAAPPAVAAATEAAAGRAAFTRTLVARHLFLLSAGLMDWDRAYVRALYEFDQERNPKLQQSKLTGTMLRLELEPFAE